MRTPIQVRLALNNLLILLLAMVLAGGLAWLAVEKLYLETQRENLVAQATLIATALYGAPFQTEAAQPYTQTANVLPGIHTRLLSEGGAVLVGLPLSGSEPSVPLPLAESSSPITPEDLTARPEIQSALRGDPGSAIRPVPTAGGRRVLYAAAPVYAADGDIAGIVYLATPLPAGGLPVNLALQFLGVLFVAVSLASLAGRGLASQIARPLQELASSAEVLASGELTHQTSLQSRITELERLEQSFNSMAEDLRRSDQAQKAFIADVSHELRTPLTVIKGTIETLEDGAMDDLRGRIPLLDSMHRETDRLIRLVNDLLVLVRADAGELRLHLQTVSLSALVQARCETMRFLAEREQVELCLKDETPEGATLQADSDRLSQVLDNLLDNAILHAPPRTTVTVLLREQQEGVTCAVCDHGPGIPEEHLARIFDRFYRVDNARDRGHGGMGLGLAISHAIVQAHSGNIWAEVDPSGGTVLAFWLPAGTPDPDSTQS